MKRIFALIIVTVSLFLCVNSASAEEYGSERPPKELQLEYMDFYDNQDYYKNLARTQGYRLVISVGPEFEKLEEARIRAGNSDFDTLVPAPAQISRGVDIPTRKHNVAKKEYKIDGKSVQSTLYTQKKVYGVTDYEVSLHNRYDASSKLNFKVIPHGFYGSGDSSFYVDAGKTVIEYMRTIDVNDTAYLEFRAPVSVEGYIKENVSGN